MPHRKNYLELLSEYNPAYSEEIAAKGETIAFVKKHPECFERSLEIGHVTASAWLLDKEGKKALLMHHKKLDMWVQLGGHCDGDSDVLQVAIREAREESGITHIVPVLSQIFDLDIHEIPEKGNVKAHLHYDVRFLLQVMSDETFQKNEESKQLLWVGPNPSELPEQNRTVVRMLHKWIHLSKEI